MDGRTPRTVSGKRAMDGTADTLEIHRAGCQGRGNPDRRVCWRKKSKVGEYYETQSHWGAQTRTCLDQVSWLPLVALAATTHRCTHLLRKVLPDNIRLVLATSADGNLWE